MGSTWHVTIYLRYYIMISIVLKFCTYILMWSDFLFKMHTEVNVEYPWQMRQPPERGCDLYIDELTFTGRNASTIYMNVCVK